MLLNTILDRAMKVQRFGTETLCSFTSHENDPDNIELANGVSLGIEEASTGFFETTSLENGLKLWPWVNQVGCV
jgi:hypothetical protein